MQRSLEGEVGEVERGPEWAPSLAALAQALRLPVRDLLADPISADMGPVIPA